MKPRWAPRWFAYVGLGPNPALPRPVGDSAPIAFYNWIEKSVLGPPNVKDEPEVKDFNEPTYVYVAINKRHPNHFYVFETERFAKQWILCLLRDSQYWEIQPYQVHGEVK